MLDAMRNARDKPQVALASYVTIRGKKPNSLIFVFEGDEDLLYYEATVKKIREDISFSPLIAKGKDQVLGLRKLIRKREEGDEKIRYFIDKDYDHAKGEPDGEDLYISEGYSIENHLVSKESLESLLRSEYKCYDPNDEAAISAILKMYSQLKSNFISLMYEPNLAIFHARKNNIRLKGIENRISQYLHIKMEYVRRTRACPFELVGWPEGYPREVSLSKEKFERLDPSLEWRGKFIFGFFIEILKILKDDRTSNSPSYFTKKAGMKYDPNGETIRSLATLATTPETLVEFIGGIPNQTAL